MSSAVTRLETGSRRTFSSFSEICAGRRGTGEVESVVEGKIGVGDSETNASGRARNADLTRDVRVTAREV